LNKTDLINEVAVKTGMTKKDTEKVVNAFFDTVQGTLKTG
jgi:DNA-binding protein HU-beta